MKSTGTNNALATRAIPRGWPSPPPSRCLPTCLPVCQQRGQLVREPGNRRMGEHPRWCVKNMHVPVCSSINLHCGGLHVCMCLHCFAVERVAIRNCIGAQRSRADAPPRLAPTRLCSHRSGGRLSATLRPPMTIVSDRQQRRFKASGGRRSAREEGRARRCQPCS